MAPYFPVVAFDLDGTLLPGTTVSILLAERFGDAGRLAALERAFVAGEVGDREVAEAAAALHAGRATADVRAVLEDAPWIAGIGAVVTTLRDAGTDVLVATIGWRLAAEVLQERFGVTAVCGTAFGEAGGVLTGTVERLLDAGDKLGFVERWCAARGLGLGDVAAVGDSRSDLPLFAAAGRAVALNATAEARAAASRVLETDDLRDVLPLLRRGGTSRYHPAP